MAAAESLSLADLESHDPHARRNGREWRFRCPLDGCAGRKQRDLSVNAGDGAWICYKCGEKGKLLDYREPKEPWKPQDRRARQRAALASMAGDRPAPKPATPPRPPKPETGGYDFEGETRLIVKIEGTPAADYMASRGIPADVASAAGVRYSASFGSTVWVLDKEGNRKTLSGAPAVVFPMRDAEKRLRGICGRVPGPGTFWKDGPNKRTFKADADGEAGVFASPSDALTAAAVAVVEAPIDALSLTLCGLATVATVGTGCPEWLLDRLAFRVVFLAHDSDEAGDKAAERIAPELRTLGARPVRLKPPTGSKDWNEALQRFGKDALAEAVARTIAPYLGTLPPAGDVAEVDPFENADPPEMESPQSPWPKIGSRAYAALSALDKMEACAASGRDGAAEIAAILERIGNNQGKGADMAEAVRLMERIEAANHPEHANEGQNAAERRTEAKNPLFSNLPLVGSGQYNALKAAGRNEEVMMACAVAGMPSSAELLAIVQRIANGTASEFAKARAARLVLMVEEEGTRIPGL